MTTTVEGQTVWTFTEPTLEQITSGDYTLPVNFKIVDVNTSTYKLISFVADSQNGARRLELGGGSLDQDNIFKVMNVTLEDLGLAQDSTEEEIKQALSNHIEGLQIEQKELYLFQIDGFQESNSTTSNPLIEVIYSELLDLKNNSQLQKGKQYLLTDYETTYTQPVTNASKSSGVIEPLIIIATDVNKLHTQCKSTLYPQDIVFYEITGDIGNGKGTEGFTKGKIYRRIDTLRNNDIGTDWRHIKYDREGVDKLLFENYTNCYNNVIKCYSLLNSVVEPNFSGNIFNGDFFKNTIGNSCQNNTVFGSFVQNTIGRGFSYNIFNGGAAENNIGNEFQGNTIKVSFWKNTFGFFCSNNTFNSHCDNNIFGGDYFEGNLFNRRIQQCGTPTQSFKSNNTIYNTSMYRNLSTPEIESGFISVQVISISSTITKQLYYNTSNVAVLGNIPRYN